MSYRFILIVYSLLFSFEAFSQKCHYEIDRVDAETELIIKRTEPVQLAEVNGQPLYFKSQCIGDKKYLKVRYFRYQGFTIQDNQPLEIGFTDGSNISLMPRQMPTKTTPTDGFVTISSMLIFNLSVDHYKQLLDKPISTISYHIDGGGKVDKEIRKRYQSDLQYIMRCVHLDSDPF